MQKTKNKTVRTSYRKGIIAERFAVMFLRAKGYKILAQRFKTRYGEIDIVARHKDIIVFIEVKARKAENDALESVTHKMKSRIERAAQLYIAQHKAAQGMGVRFDFIALSPPFFFRHLDNAWRPAT